MRFACLWRAGRRGDAELGDPRPTAIAVTRTLPADARRVTTAQKSWRGYYVSPHYPLRSQQAGDEEYVTGKYPNEE